MSAQASFARKNHRKPARSDGRKRGISAGEVKDVEELATPRTPVIYEVVRRLGEEEMARPFTSLWWSGVAAGLSISFSLLAQAILRTHLPDAPWQPLLTSFGYCVGFIMAVLSRQQLFTESTITAVLPVVAEFTWKNIGRMARLWAIVLAANLAGTLFAALFCTYTPVLPAQIYDGMVTVSRDLLAFSWSEMLFRAVAAGFLMAAMVWLMPGAERAIPRYHAHDVAHRCRRLYPYRRRQHGSLPSDPGRRVDVVADGQPIHGARADRQYRRRHSVIRADRLCPSDGRNLTPARQLKSHLSLKKCR